MDDSGAKPAHQNFIRNARAAIYVWLTLSMLLTILVFTVLLVPHWLGHSAGAFTSGHMGLYERCIVGSSAVSCSGRITDFSSIGNGPLQGATLLMIFSCVLCILSLLITPLVFLFSKGRVIMSAGIMQVVVAILVFLVCIIFPAGWDDERVRQLCGISADKFALGACRLRWAFPLAILTFIDAAAVASLGLVLASKLIKVTPTQKVQYGRGAKVAPLSMQASVYARKVVDIRALVLRRNKQRNNYGKRTGKEELGQPSSGFTRMRHRNDADFMVQKF